MKPIPAVQPYPMPQARDLPVNTAPWQVHPRRAVLLVHDMQRYFLRPFGDGRTRQALVRNAARLREQAATSGVPVAYTAQPGGMTDGQRGLLKDFWGPGMQASPGDREVVEPLSPGPDDWLLTKWRYSAFFRTDLLERMRADGRDQLVLCGVYAHIGVLMTAVDAFTHDIQPFLAADAMADFDETYHRLALYYAAERCGVVATTDSLLPRLST